MPTTSAKHRDFVGEPMGEKEVTQLAGVGDTYGKILASKGFDRAYTVLGQFLILKKDEELFIAWLKDEIGMNSHHAHSTFQCLQEWTDQHL